MTGVEWTHCLKSCLRIVTLIGELIEKVLNCSFNLGNNKQIDDKQYDFRQNGDPLLNFLLSANLLNFKKFVIQLHL